MINDKFQPIHLQQRKVRTSLFNNAKEAFTSASEPQRYHAKYLVIDSDKPLPQKIFMQSNICPVFIYDRKSYIFQQGEDLYTYFLSKKQQDLVLCQQEIWRLLQQVVSALILLREAGFQHRHLKQYAIRRITPDHYKLMFHPTMLTARYLIEKKIYNSQHFYLAPEQLQDISQEQSTTCVFALGAMLLNIMNPLDFRRDIYSRNQYRINGKVLEEKIVNASIIYTAKLINIIKSMLIQNHERRITLERLIYAINQANPFEKKLQMTTSIKQMVNNKLSKSKQKISYSPKNINGTPHTGSHGTKQKHKQNIVTKQWRGTFGGNHHQSVSSSSNQSEENYEQQTSHTKYTGINSKAKIQSIPKINPDYIQPKPTAQRSYSQYLQNSKNKEQNMDNYIVEPNSTKAEAYIKMDIKIDKNQQKPKGYNEYMHDSTKTKKIHIELTKPDHYNNFKYKQQNPQQQYDPKYPQNHKRPQHPQDNKNPQQHPEYPQYSKYLQQTGQVKLPKYSTYPNYTEDNKFNQDHIDTGLKSPLPPYSHYYKQPNKNIIESQSKISQFSVREQQDQNIQASVQRLKTKMNHFHLKLTQCLQQPYQIAKRLGHQGVWINGNVYYGLFRNGRRNGLALQIFPNKQYYFGYYHDDMFHGEGFYFWNSNQHFLGIFEAGAKQQGTWYGKNKYTGQIKQNKRHGIGSYIYSNGRIYEGEWHMGKRHGSGLIIEPSGEKFIGMFKMGKKWGQGTEILQGLRVNAVWDDQVPVDKVEIVYEDGRVYVGKANKDLEMEGEGELRFSTGSVCRGIFENGSFVFGEMVYRNGERYIGNVQEMRRHGKGTYFYIGGREVTGHWKDNVLVMEE